MRERLTISTLGRCFLGALEPPVLRLCLAVTFDRMPFLLSSGSAQTFFTLGKIARQNFDRFGTLGIFSLFGGICALAASRPKWPLRTGLLVLGRFGVAQRLRIIAFDPIAATVFRRV